MSIRIPPTFVAVLAGAAAATIGGAALEPGGASARVTGPTLVVSCGQVSQGGFVRPRSWSTACLGGSFNVERLRWTTYRPRRAVALGVTRVNACDPDCSRGPLYFYPTKLIFSGVAVCRTDRGPRRFYMRTVGFVRYPVGNVEGFPPGWRATRAFRTGGCE